MIRWAIAFALLCQPVMAQELELTPDWEYVADTVMGGVSSGARAARHHRGA
ncbi:hypothetical protein [uncultured Tateyamaria sp.]|uniref:hypothetical protein n=1 Tax=uncultured Tateyamaria sp. TaxID=455651 RepID=UPI00345C1A1C